MERVTKKQNYARAFKCEACPGTDDETGCPNWWRWEEVDSSNPNNKRVVEQCGFVASKYFEVQRLANTRFVVDNTVETRNMIANTTQQLVTFVQAARERKQGILGSASNKKLIS